MNDVPLQLRRKGRPPLEVTLSATPVYEPSGAVVRSRSVLRDVSERRQAQAKLDEAMRMREQFLAMVSHELRSPLHAINSAFQIIDSPRAQDAQRDRSEQVVRRQTQRMVRLVDDLLDVSRILHGKLHLERGPLNLSEVVRAAVDAVAPAYQDRGVRLVLDGAERAWPVIGDEGRLEQVIANLLQNALRASAPGTEVRVSCAQEGDRCAVAVADQGRGIAADDLGRIFDMFVQSAQGLARSEGGLGLGLTIANHIVGSHGGTLRARSEGLGQGATFTMLLPLGHADAKPVRRAEREADTMSIVIVEDQDDARESLRTLLEIDGHDVAAAADGEAGLRLVLDRQPDVGLLDIGLPLMNGYDLAQAIRARLGDRIRLVAMSGYGQPDDVRKALASGFDRHLTKPVDPKRLALALQELPDRPAS